MCRDRVFAYELDLGQLHIFLVRRCFGSSEAGRESFWSANFFGGLTHMARLLLAKMASAAALLSTSVMLTGCWTTSGRPTLCDFGYAPDDGRCAKVTKTDASRRDQPEAGRGRGSEY